METKAEAQQTTISHDEDIPQQHTAFDENLFSFMLFCIALKFSREVNSPVFRLGRPVYGIILLDT